jgi:hypothetical protein
MLSVDTGYCNPDANLDLMALNGVDLFIFKATESALYYDEEWEKNVAKAKAGNHPFFGYHFDDPMVPAARQLKWFTDHNCHKQGVKCIVLDIEDETDYNKGIIPAQNLYLHAVDMWREFEKLGQPMTWYSRDSWFQDYCPQLKPFLQSKNAGWLASYPEIRTTAEIILRKKPVVTTWIDLRQRFIKIQKYAPSSLIWQFSGDTFALPGSGTDWRGNPCGLDINYSALTLDELFAKLGISMQNLPPKLSWDKLSAQEKDELLHKLAVKDGLFTD